MRSWPPWVSCGSAFPLRNTRDLSCPVTTTSVPTFCPDSANAAKRRRSSDFDRQFVLFAAVAQSQFMRAGGDGREIGAFGQEGRLLVAHRGLLGCSIARIYVDAIAHAAHDHRENAGCGDWRLDYGRRPCSRGKSCGKTTRRTVELQGVIPGRNLVERPLRILQVNGRLIVERHFARGGIGRQFQNREFGLRLRHGRSWLHGNRLRQRLRCLIVTAQERPDNHHQNHHCGRGRQHLYVGSTRSRAGTPRNWGRGLLRRWSWNRRLRSLHGRAGDRRWCRRRRWRSLRSRRRRGSLRSSASRRTTASLRRLDPNWILCRSLREGSTFAAGHSRWIRPLRLRGTCRPAHGLWNRGIASCPRRWRNRLRSPDGAILQDRAASSGGVVSGDRAAPRL